MSILFKARGSTSFGILVIRLVIGTTFLLSGANKVMNIEAFINHVKSFDIFSQNTSFILGFILPFIEVIFGAFYIIGIFTPITSFALSVIIISIMIVGKDTTVPAGQFVLPQVTFHLIMLSATLMTLFSGAGVISFDALFDKKKKQKTEERNQVSSESVKPPEGIEEAKFTDLIEERKDEPTNDI